MNKQKGKVDFTGEVTFKKDLKMAKCIPWNLAHEDNGLSNVPDVW